MEDMKNRHHPSGKDDAPLVHDTLRHAYQPPPKRPVATRPMPADIIAPIRPAPTHIPTPEHRPKADPQPVHHSPAPSPARHLPRRRPKRRLSRKIAAVGLVLVLLAGGAAYAYPKYSKTNPFPASIRDNTPVSLLYPEKLPAGYSIAPSSFQLASGVVIYSAASGQNHLVFTIQKQPADFDFNNFYKKQLLNTTTFDTSIGQAAIGTVNGRLVGSLKTGQTWLLVNSDASQLQPADLGLVLKNIKQESK